MEFDKVIVSGAFAFTNTKVYLSPKYLSTCNINKFYWITFICFVCKTNVVFSLCNYRKSKRINALDDFNDLEKELFSKVELVDYYTAVMKIKGLDHLLIGFYNCVEFMDDPTTIGNLVENC